MNLYNLTVAYLTDARFWLQWERNERICELGGLEYLLNPCSRLDAQLHPGLEPALGSNLDDEYSVTQYQGIIIISSGGTVVRFHEPAPIR